MSIVEIETIPLDGEGNSLYLYDAHLSRN
jgi:hypothetical protein